MVLSSIPAQRALSVLAGILAFLLIGGSQEASATAQRRGDLSREIHEVYPFEPNGRISLENINGDTRIQTWDRNEVKVDAVISAYSQERLDEIEVDINARPGRIYIETRYPNRDWSRDRHDGPTRVDYTLTVPKTAILDEVKLINGSIDVKGVEGDVYLSSINGRILAEGLNSQARISTVNGDMELVWNRMNRQTPLEVSSVNGSIRITIPSDASARLRAGTVHGRISNNFDLPVQRGRLVGRNMEGRIGGGEGRIELNNVNGEIDVRFASDGRSKSKVENMLRDTGRDDEDFFDFDRDDDHEDQDEHDHDMDDDDDDWSSRDLRSGIRELTISLSHTVEEVRARVSEALNEVLGSLDFDGAFHTFPEARISHEAQREAQRAMREAQREMRRSMKEMRRDLDRLPEND